MLKIGNKVYRNMQEQVAKNQEDIAELKEIIAGLTGYTASNGVKLVENDFQADTSVMATLAYAQTAATNAANGVRKYPYKIIFDIENNGYHYYVLAYLIINPNALPTTNEELISALKTSGTNTVLIPTPSYNKFQGGPTDKGAFVLNIEFNASTKVIDLNILDLNANEVVYNQYSNWTYEYY